MAFVGNVYVLVATCLTVICVAQEQSCDNWMMAKKTVIPEKDFQRQLNRHYRRSTAGTQCVPECFTDERCTDVILCNGRCYFLGMFITNTSTTEDYGSCSLLQFNRCKNGGISKDHGYCSCPVGFGGRYCEQIIDDICYNSWKAVFDTEGIGNKNDLLYESGKSCPVLMKMMLDGQRVQQVDSYGVDRNEVWAQTWYRLTKSSWDAFETTPKRRFDVVRSNGYMASMEYSMEGTMVKKWTSTLAVKLFVKQHTADIPDFVNDSIALANDLQKLLVKIENGAEVSLFDTIFVSPNQTSANRTAAAERVKGFGLIHELPIDLFITPAYWELEKYTTSGGYASHRWKLGEARSYSNVQTGELSTFWCTDTCWRKAFTVDVSGMVSFGSVSDLASSVLNGHGVRVYVNSIAAKTKAIYIHGETITALVHNMMDPLDVGVFSSSAIAYMSMVSTSGSTTTRRYTFESGNVISETVKQCSIHWYVDTRPWIRVLVVEGNGVTRFGSVTKLTNFVKDAASVRLVVEYNSGHRQAMDVDHLEFAADGNSVAADVIHHSQVQIDEESKISFKNVNSYHRWSAIITSLGQFQKFHYTFKRNDGMTEQVTDVLMFNWFVQP